LVGKNDAFNQLSSELIIDASRFCNDFNWIPSHHPFDMLKATSGSFV